MYMRKSLLIVYVKQTLQKQTLSINPSEFWRCWLAERKGIVPAKNTDFKTPYYKQGN